MALICALAATALLFVWIFLTLGVTKEDIVDILIAKKKNCYAALKASAREERQKIREALRNGADEKGKKVSKIKKKYLKKNRSTQKEIDKFESGQIGILDIMPACGYALLKLIHFDINGKFFRKLTQNLIRVNGKESAALRAKYLVGATAAYLMIGLMTAFSLTSLFINLDNENAVLLGIIILFMTVILCYVPFSNLKQAAEYRTERIEAEFPDVVSKLAMLINSGMEVSKAWELTAYSNEGILYDEMKSTVELQNSNVSPIEAYTQFMNNCNNKYTSKLSTSIMQNLSKGNAEIGALFIQLSSESWSERKHNSKRLGEKAQSKLLIPTLMIFGGILVMIIVPIFSSVAESV